MALKVKAVELLLKFERASKDELKNTAIQITCIDRNGKEVKRVTSSDAGNIEDNENPSTGSGTAGNQGGNTGGGGGCYDSSIDDD
jgi:uncharacterized membrane protein